MRFRETRRRLLPLLERQSEDKMKDESGVHEDLHKDAAFSIKQKINIEE